jgi:hypothetical protein
MDGALNLVFLDFETYFDTEYSLRRMPTPNYILDPRFELQMCAVKINTGLSQIIDGPDFPKWLSNLNPSRTVTVSHNALFDNSILSYRYGFVPHMMLDTLGMSRALLGHVLKSHSLAAVAEHLGLGAKGTALLNVKGMRRQDIINNGLWQGFQRYCLQDNDLCAGIFKALIPQFPEPERRLMDLVLRCAVVPRFICDTQLLQEHLVDVRQEQQDLIAACSASKVDLNSAAKFKKMLEDRGVEIQYKTSAATGKETPAFAKTDQFMADLLEHPDLEVQALAAARLGVKSTIEETRSAKLLSIGQLPWPSHLGSMPVPLAYGKAHTHRLAGEWGMNMQNLPSGRKKDKNGNPISKLRRSLVAPPGYKVITADLGQIEARLSAFICNCTQLLDQFAKKQDPYAKMGTAIFGFEVDPIVHKLERFIGKTAILGLGYGCGWRKFYTMVITSARQFGIPLGSVWNEPLAEKSVQTYRRVNWPMQAGWSTLDNMLKTCWLGKHAPMKFGPGALVEIGPGYVKLPNEMYLRYADPMLDTQTGELTYRHGKFTHKIYGAKLLENIVQALARIVVMNAALRIRGRGDKSWSRFVLQAHDELVFIVPDAEVDKAKLIIHEEMTRRPSWAPSLPLTADVGVGQSYGEAK